MSKEVGDYLKKLYKKQKYSKVDFDNIEMSTEGMGSGNVVFKLAIPFVQVADSCEAYTSFDHVGGWRHTPALEKRKGELSNLLIEDDVLAISKLKKTKEGLEEYWIQWRHRSYQTKCDWNNLLKVIKCQIKC